MTAKSAGVGLYEFLIEAELQHYYSALKNELKVQNVSQLKYVSEEDMAQIGMSRPEMRRMTKFFHKHCPQTYLAKMKKKLLQRRDDPSSVASPGQSSDVPRPIRTVAPGRHIIQADAIVSHKTLGQGEFGTVQQGVWTSEEGERIQVAIKCLSQERMENNPVEFLKEAAIMHSVDHEHIVRLYGVVLDTTSLVLVTELAPLRSLLECLKEPVMRPNLTIQTLFDFSIQICDGMEYLEEKRLIHRDLAARNILVFSKSKVKISDFGLSRALGVGKDYYQTNFNVNLKLPIAWCAPECINFLRFTSASDVWAFGVTLWEMYSYGFQPWAALTGQQILEAIDEPNYHRLERPEFAPGEMYYQIMLKCWQHSPTDRPTFSQLMNLLPECKPELVQAIRESGGRRDVLSFEPGDLITVIDKKPTSTNGSCCDDNVVEWKGVLKCGKTGLFNPANTITYLGPSLPSVRDGTQRFTRNESRTSSLRKGRLSADMISHPQGDLKHTGHVGPDGNFFGDIAFINTKSWVPRQVVSPYKPELARDDTAVMAAINGRRLGDIDSSRDTDPLIWENRKEMSVQKNWKKLVLPYSTGGSGCCHANSNSLALESEPDHEYHEISDEENEMLNYKSKSRVRELGLSNPGLSSHSPLQSPFDKNFEPGPSLMEEVFGALEQDRKAEFDSSAPFSSFPSTFSACAGGGTGRSNKKKFATVKPVSSKDQKRLDQAIAVANELASRSMLELDVRNSMSFDDISSPTEPGHRKKFSFLIGSTKGLEKERRNYTQEAASIPDIQSTLSQEAKEAYNSLIEKPSSIGSLGVLTPSFENKSSSFNFPEKCVSKKSAFFDKEPLCPPPPSPFFDSLPVQPSELKSTPCATSTPIKKTFHGKSESWSGSTPVATPPEVEEEEDQNPLRLLRLSKNVLPLPPKKNSDPGPGHGHKAESAVTKLSSVLTQSSRHHQRKHPLLIPPKVQAPVPFDEPVVRHPVPPPPPPKPQRQHVPASPSPPKPSILLDNDIRYELRNGNQAQAELGPKCRSNPIHVPLYENYEDNVELDSNGNQSEGTENTLEVDTLQSTVTETQQGDVEPLNTPPEMDGVVANVVSPAPNVVVLEDPSEPTMEINGEQQSERPLRADLTKIKTVQRILGASATERECAWALDLCREDAAHAVKLLRLKTLLPPTLLETDVERVVSVLEMSHWDVARASDFLLNPNNLKKSRVSLRNLGRRGSSPEGRENNGPTTNTSNGHLTTPKYITPTRV